MGWRLSTTLRGVGDGIQLLVIGALAWRVSGPDAAVSASFLWFLASAMKEGAR